MRVPQIEGFDHALYGIRLDSITHIERPAEGQKNSCKKILSDITESKTKNDPSYPGAGEQTPGYPSEFNYLHCDGKAYNDYGPLEHFGNKFC